MLLRKPFNIDAIKASFMKAWQIKDGLDIKEVFDRVFLFHFDDPFSSSQSPVKATLELQQIAFGLL